MGKKKAKKKPRKPRNKGARGPKPPEWRMRVCPLLSDNCIGPNCRLWISPDDSENGECIVLLAGLRLLTGDDENFNEVTKNLIRQIVTKSGKGIAALLKSVLGDMCSNLTGTVRVPPAPPDDSTDGSTAKRKSSGLRGLDAEEG